MKSNKEIVGLRIISVAEGTQIGTIKDFILNPSEGTLDFFVVDQSSDYFGAKVIAFSDIFGVGEFALTIPDPNVIQDVSQNSNVQDLIKKDVRVIGTNVLTKKGQLFGEVKEIFFNEETGKIEKCIFEVNGENKEVSSQQIITYGKELLIIDENITLNQGDYSQEVSTESKIDTNINAGTEDQNHDDETEGFNLFEQRQLQYFIGKAVEKDITLDTGDVLYSGQPMTEDIISKIKKRSTLMEISSHLQKN